jgi:hypothetical protein
LKKVPDRNNTRDMFKQQQQPQQQDTDQEKKWIGKAAA